MPMLELSYFIDGAKQVKKKKNGEKQKKKKFGNLTKQHQRHNDLNMETNRRCQRFYAAEKVISWQVCLRIFVCSLYFACNVCIHSRSRPECTLNARVQDESIRRRRKKRQQIFIFFVIIFYIDQCTTRGVRSPINSYIFYFCFARPAVCVSVNWKKTIPMP